MKNSSYSFTSVANGDVLFTPLSTNTGVTPNSETKRHDIENSENVPGVARNLTILFFEQPPESKLFIVELYGFRTI